MDELITICLLAALAVLFWVAVEHMHDFMQYSYTKIAAITFPIWACWLAMFYLTLTH